MRFAPILLLVPALAGAQTSTRQDPIATSRPSFSDTSNIVPVRSLQLEFGGAYYARGRAETERTDFGEAILRYGLRPRTELRLTLPTYTLFAGGPSGFDNTGIGISHYLGKREGFDLGVIGTVFVPTGAAGVRSSIVSPALSFNFARAVSVKDTFGGTLQAQLSEVDGRRVASTQASLFVQRAFCPTTAAFFEVAGFYDRVSLPRNYVHIGVTRLVSHDAQFDLHGGFGLGPASHGFVGAGYSIRF